MDARVIKPVLPVALFTLCYAAVPSNDLLLVETCSSYPCLFLVRCKHRSGGVTVNTLMTFSSRRLCEIFYSARTKDHWTCFRKRKCRIGRPASCVQRKYVVWLLEENAYLEVLLLAPLLARVNSCNAV